MASVSKRQLFGWKRSNRVLFSYRLAPTLNTAVSQQPSQPVKWHGALFALQWEEGNEVEHLLLGLKKKSTALCSEHRDIDCQSEMSLTVSPHLHILESVDISSVMGAFARFLRSAAILLLQIIALIWPAEQRVPATLLITCPVVNYDRLIGI